MAKKPKDPQEVMDFILRCLKEEYGQNIIGTGQNANIYPNGATIAFRCKDRPFDTDGIINVHYVDSRYFR